MLQTVSARMPAKKSNPKGLRNDIAVKVDRTLADKAKLVASRRGVTLAQYLTDLIRNPVEKDFAKVVKEMEAES